MKFILFAEGHTEKKALPAFLKRWLNPQLAQPVGIKVVRFDGWSDYVRDIAKKVDLHLTGPSASEVIAAIGLLDLYGPTFYPAASTSVAQRYAWGKSHLTAIVGNPKFCQHFAVHETEAWLLSDSDILPVKLPPICAQPERVNFVTPPAKLLNNLYRIQLSRPYKKVVDGYELFKKLAPARAKTSCPYFSRLLDDMLGFARRAGL